MLMTSSGDFNINTRVCLVISRTIMERTNIGSAVNYGTTGGMRGGLSGNLLRPLVTTRIAECNSLMNNVKWIIYILIVLVFFCILAYLLNWSVGISFPIIIIVFIILIYLGFISTTSCFQPPAIPPPSMY